jgi:sulfatase maturation enzyme AslB (radical SAM superfamily)
MGLLLDSKSFVVLNLFFARLFQMLYPSILRIALQGKVNGAFEVRCRNSILTHHFNLFFSDVDIALLFAQEQKSEVYTQLLRIYRTIQYVLPNLGEAEFYLKSEWIQKTNLETQSPQLLEIRKLRKIFWTKGTEKNHYDQKKRLRSIDILKRTYQVSREASELVLAETLVKKVTSSLSATAPIFSGHLDVFHPFLGVKINCNTNSRDAIQIAPEQFFKFFSIITLNVFEFSEIDFLRKSSPDIQRIWLNHLRLEKISVKNVIRCDGAGKQLSQQWLEALDQRLNDFLATIKNQNTNERSPTWCPYPWINLNSNTDGRVKLCCSIVDDEHISESLQDLNFADHSIERIWNSQYIQNIRSEMLQGKKPKACRVCWKLEANGAQSSRQAAIENFQDWAPQSLFEISTALPNSLELRLGNNCNLKCVSCWSLSSSSIFDERQKNCTRKDISASVTSSWNYEIQQSSKAKWDWFSSAEFKKSFAKLAPSLKRLYLTGGEPNLIAENLTFLSMLLEANNTSCHISITTNATVWNTDLYDLLGRFQNAEVQVSLDGCREMNEYVRYPSKWSQIENNLRKMNELPKHIEIRVLSVVSLLNADSIIPLLKYLEPLFKDRKFSFAPILLQSPEFLSTGLLTHNYRQKLSQEIDSFLEQCNFERRPTGWFMYGLLSMKNYLNQDGSSDKRALHLREAIDYIEALERIRQNTHPHKQRLLQEGLGLEGKDVY